MLSNKDIINSIYASLLQSSCTADYEFMNLRGNWGYKLSERYQQNRILLNKNIRRLANEAPILFDSGLFYMFNGKIYAPVAKDLVGEAFKLLMEHLEIYPALGVKSYVDDFLDYIEYSNPMVESRNLIAFENGVLDIGPILRGKEPIFYDAFNPRFHVTYYHPYKYDKNARCVKWNNFLHEVLPDKNSRVILQMFLGLGLIDSSEIYLPYEGKDAARVELCLLLIGSGGNGKSVIYRTARGVYGSERISDVPYAELVSTGDEGMRARLPLRHKIFNWSTEEDSRTFCRRGTSTFKRIVSGEPVMDRKLGGNITKNDNLPYLVFHLNELPYPDDQSLGFIRRLQFISFDVTVPKERRNPQLAQELITNYPGIFNWIVRGAREVIRKKFHFPSSEGHRRQMLLSQLRSNPVVAWVNAYHMRPNMQAQHEVCEWVPTADIITSIEQFCDDNEAECPSKQKIGHTLAKLGFFKKRNQEGNMYQIYGCEADSLRRPYLIKWEDMSVSYEGGKESFISEDD